MATTLLTRAVYLKSIRIAKNLNKCSESFLALDPDDLAQAWITCQTMADTPLFPLLSKEGTKEWYYGEKITGCPPSPVRALEDIAGDNWSGDCSTNPLPFPWKGKGISHPAGMTNQAFRALTARRWAAEIQDLVVVQEKFSIRVVAIFDRAWERYRGARAGLTIGKHRRRSEAFARYG
jgi:hypothetical protein